MSERGWTAEERRTLQRALAGGAPLACPACGGEITRSPVTPPAGVPYVRHRVLLVCAGCRRSAAVDAPLSGGGRP